MVVNNESDRMRGSGPHISCRNLPGEAESQHSVPDPRFERETSRIQVSNITTETSQNAKGTYLE